MMAIGVGIIGYGLAGSAFHAPVIAAVPGLELRAIASSKHETIARDWPGVAAVSVEALLADPAIDLVVVASPNDSHAPLARRAIEAGKHVVVDKPFATRSADIEPVAALAAERGRVAVPFHNRRWDGDFLTVRGLVESGRPGEVMLYEARWDRFRLAGKGGWREVPGDEGGLLIDLGPHLIDQALLLFGMPEAVSGDIAIQRPGLAVDDYFELTLHYGARRVILSASTLVAAPRPRFAIHGTRGSFVKSGLDPQEAQLRAGLHPGDSGYGEEAAEQHGRFTDRDGGNEAVASLRGDYRGFYAGVAAAISDGVAPPVRIEDAIAGIRIIEAARTSAGQGSRITIG